MRSAASNSWTFLVGDMDTISACRARDWGPIALIGEYTVPSGPAFDDHFLVVILQDGRTIEYPTEKIGEIISELQHVTKSRIELSLCNSTKAASRVIFPPELAGRKLYAFRETPLGLAGLLQAVFRFGVTEVSMQLTPEVEDYMSELKR